MSVYISVAKKNQFFFFFKFIFHWWLFYNTGLISVVHQHKLATGVHISPPSWTLLPPVPTPLGCYRAPVWVPWVMHRFPLAVYFAHCCRSVTQLCLILQPHGLQHARLPCPSPYPRVCPSSCSLHQWCCPAISSSDTIFSSCSQSFLALGTFPMSHVCIRWPKYWSFSFSISPSREYSGLISLKIDWFDLPAVQRILRNLLQHYSSKASILWCSSFFTVQLSQPYMTTGKIIALTILTFVSRGMSLLFNTLSSFIITFLPRKNCLLFHGCSHHLQLFWSPRRRNLSLLPHFPLLFAM